MGPVIVPPAMTKGMSVFPLQERPQVVHTCRLCPKFFKRAEHRNRHEQSHSQEKSFACRICSRRYARSDLATRHEKTIHKDELLSPAFSSQTKTAPLQKRQRLEVELSATTAAADKDAQGDSLQLTLTPPLGTSDKECLSLSGATEIAETTDSLDLYLSTSEDCFDFSNGLSSDFFDPFYGQVFGHFALPPDESQFMTSEQSEVVPVEFNQVSHPHDPEREIPPPLSDQHATGLDASMAHQDYTESKTQPRATNQYGLTITENVKTRCFEDLESHLTTEQLKGFHLPNTTALQQCFDSYVEVFHIHFPFLHLPTLDLMAAPSPLILGICAIGALHRLERRLAASLYFMAERILASIEIDRLQSSPALLLDWARPQNSPATDLAPLAIAQARLIAVFFAGFSGVPRLIRQALVGCGHISADFRLRRSLVKSGTYARDVSQWTHWAETESTKRYMCTCVVLGNLLTIAYGTVPGFSALEDCDVELPVEDGLWDAVTSSKWESLPQGKPRSSTISLRRAASSFFNADNHNKSPQDKWTWSPFATSVVMHQVALNVWFLTQGQQACGGGMQGNGGCQQPEAPRMEAALLQCRKLLKRNRTGNDATWDEAESPLLFNAFAVLRVCYGRAFMTVRLLDRSLLFNESIEDMRGILKRYFDAIQERDQFTTMAVNRALEGFAIPIRAGILLTQKTAAFKWSVEHALAGWDAALLVTKWVHTIEQLQKVGQKTAPEETQALANVCHLLCEVDLERTQPRSLAAELARVWAGLYDDTWVWGSTFVKDICNSKRKAYIQAVAPRIGWVLRELAAMYEQGTVHVS